MAVAPHPLEFFGRLFWIDGKPLLDTVEDYRREFLTKALYTFRDDGTPLYNLVLSGRAKKNWKTTDLVLSALYRLVMWQSPQGNDGFIIANDEDQAGDDLSLGKKLIAANPDTLARELITLSKGIRRSDNRGSILILPARDAIGSHGKTALFLGFDEVHGYRTWDIFEALALDPTRPDALTYVTSYDSIYNSPGSPLFDMKAAGKRGDDPRMLFSWYSGGDCTDPAFADLPPEERANPSMRSWPEGRGYLEQQRRRLPTHKYRRLHLNLPGAPDGAFLDGDVVMRAIIPDLRKVPREFGKRYVAGVDMSGGSSDDACLAIAHREGSRRCLDLLIAQDGSAPFNPRDAVRKFVRAIREYGLNEVWGDAYAGETFRRDFEDAGIKYRVSELSRTELYEELEPPLNAGEVELLDIPKLRDQLLTLVVRGSRVDHQAGDHDDFSNAAALAIERAQATTDGKPTVVYPGGRPALQHPGYADPLAAYRVGGGPATPLQRWDGLRR